MLEPDFCLKAACDFGDSIRAGDLVYAVNQSDAEPGDLVVVKLPNDEATLRRLYMVGGVRVFASDNELDYPPVLESNELFTIIGKAVGVEWSSQYQR